LDEDGTVLCMSYLNAARREVVVPYMHARRMIGAAISTLHALLQKHQNLKEEKSGSRNSIVIQR
jgi:hypothetical protein